MTTFILHGGYTSTPNENNKRYYLEIAKRIPKNGRILFVYFANEESKWESLLENDKENFKKFGNKINFECEIASKNKEELIKQIKSSDCIYLRGGENYELIDIIKNLGNFGKLINGKIVVGSSMGAYIISKYFYSQTKNKIMEGLSLAPLKTLVHYKESDKEALEKLKDFKEDLPVYVLKDTEFVTITQ